MQSVPFFFVDGTEMPWRVRSTHSKNAYENILLKLRLNRDVDILDVYLSEEIG
jgi:hypothetical protein